MNYIYALKDPRDDAVRYIGKTNRPDKRLEQHLADTKDTPKVAWLDELKGLGLEPEMDLLEQLRPSEDWSTAEKWWIADAQIKGWPLTNLTKGGGGDAGERKPVEVKYDFFRSYIPDELWPTFKGMDDEQRVMILSLTSRWMVCHSNIAARAEGITTVRQDDRLFLGHIGRLMATRLINASGDESRYGALAAEINERSDSVMTAVDAYVERLD